MGEKLADAIPDRTGRTDRHRSRHHRARHRAPTPRRQSKTVLAQRKQLATEVEEILDTHPLAGVLTSMPGIAIRTAARILLEIGDASAFKTSGHLAAYASIAPSPGQGDVYACVRHMGGRGYANGRDHPLWMIPAIAAL
jgi:transposase